MSGGGVASGELTSLDDKLSLSRYAVVVSGEGDLVGGGGGVDSTDGRVGSLDYEGGGSEEDGVSAPGSVADEISTLGSDGDDANEPGSDEEMFDAEDEEDQADEEDKENEKMDEDDDEGEYNESEEWQWLEAFCTTLKRDIDGEPDQQIASCKACFIDREPVRHNFYTQREEPTRDLAVLPFAVFDRWGCLKFRDQGSSHRERLGDSGETRLTVEEHW